MATGCSALFPAGAVCCVDVPTASPTPAPTEFDAVSTWWVWLAAAAGLACFVLLGCGLCLLALYMRRRKLDAQRRRARARKEQHALARTTTTHHPLRGRASGAHDDGADIVMRQAASVHAPSLLPPAPRDSRPMPPPPAPLPPPPVSELPPPPPLARPSRAFTHFAPLAAEPENEVLLLDYIELQPETPTLTIDNDSRSRGYTALPHNESTKRAQQIFDD